ARAAGGRGGGRRGGWRAAGSAGAPPGARVGGGPLWGGVPRTGGPPAGIATRMATATASEEYRQRRPTASEASPGRNTSCPAAPAAVSIPVTSPRRATNHRLATVVASTPAIAPVPVPTTTPQSRSSCHGARMNGVDPTPV